MRRCPICEGLLEESLYQNGDQICRVCRVRLKQYEDVEYAATGRKTTLQAHVDLILAIRQQAMLDDELEIWERFWVATEPWPRIWELLQTAVKQKRMIRNDLRSHIGGRR